MISFKRTPIIPQYKIEEIRQIHHQGKSQEDFHKLMAGKYIGDIVFGANDGIITTFAVVAGVAGASLSPAVVLILGSANLLADGFSMAAGNFLARRSERQYEQTERKREEWEVDRLPKEEKQEIREIYAAKGFMGADLERVVDIITRDKKVWVDEMMISELKIVGDEDNKPIKNAVATFTSFVIAGAVPLVPYIFGLAGNEAFKWAIVATAICLFMVGSLRTHITGIKWWLAGVEMLGVGAVAASVAYVVGYLLGNLI